MSITTNQALSAAVLDPREIALEGSVNFRDLGGITNRHDQVIRQGKVFRSDALARLTPVDLDRLAGLEIATLLDLRTATEQARSGPSPLTNTGTRVIHAPVVDVDASPGTIANRPLAELYGDFLTHGMTAYHRVFSALATEGDLPAVIHCAAGKDRTGVAVALLLRVLNVADEVIIADYAITDRNVQRMIQGWIAADPELASGRKSLEIPEAILSAKPETMAMFLVTLDATYGSAEDYLLATGITTQELDSLRKTLLH